MSDSQDTDTAQAPADIPEPRFYGEDMVQEVIARMLADGRLSLGCVAILEVAHG